MTALPELLLHEPAGLARSGERLQLGVPFERGLLHADDRLALELDDGALWPIQTSASSVWPDGSVRWALVTALIDLPAGYDGTARLVRAEDLRAEPKGDFDYRHEDGELRLSNSRLTLTSRPGSDTLFEIHTDGRGASGHRARLQLSSNLGELHPVVEGAQLCPSSGPLSTAVLILGRVEADYFDCAPRFECRLSLQAQSARVDLEFCLHNPQAARHPGGLWDLGDAGSFLFDDCHLALTGPRFDHARLTLGPGRTPLEQALDGTPLCLYQEASGGDFWNSPNHLNRHGEVPLRQPGYRLTAGGAVLAEGLRAEPAWRLAGPDVGLAVLAHRFWQNCPSSLAASATGLAIGFFPDDFPDDFELQGGESKRHCLTLAFDADANTLDALAAPVSARLAMDEYRRAAAFPAFGQGDTAELDALIHQGIEGPHCFFAKREQADEYGWRHFGDLYADHENRPGAEHPVMSHYNNQYDPLYGFARQYALTGDTRWYDLMDDLARHLVDIDLYKTERDKADYNGGLFWHTDHYLDAATSSHRTYSRHHEAVYEDYQAGGGPGGEHCYTTGLLYHYWLTGHAPSREAVLTLTDWITRFYEGSGSLTERLLDFLRKDLAHLKREPTGKWLAQYRYPLDRGVGNYLTALIDSYLLTADAAYLDQAGRVIAGTLHPREDLAKRRLDRVELAWFYTILLQAVARFLMVKAEAGAQDEAFHYARAALLHYAAWMRENEYIYLERPEQLEFPNHTWTAQELRKANLFYYAAYFSNAEADIDAYLALARRFAREATQTLAKTDEADCTRVLAIAMQNHGHAALADTDLAWQARWRDDWQAPAAPVYSRRAILSRFARDLGGRLVRLSPRRELTWLAGRSARLTGLLSRTGFQFYRRSP